LHIELDRDRGTAKLGVDAPAAVEGEIGAAGRVRPVLLAMQVERRGAYTLIVYRPAARGGRATPSSSIGLVSHRSFGVGGREERNRPRARTT